MNTNTIHRAHATTIARTQALRHHLPAETAARPVDAGWISLRTARFEAASGVSVRLVLRAATYRSLTGQLPSPRAAGQACLYALDGTRMNPAVVFLDLSLLHDRGQADRVLAHEFMHVCWPSYGHKAAAFERAQQLLDALAP